MKNRGKVVICSTSGVLPRSFCNTSSRIDPPNRDFLLLKSKRSNSVSFIFLISGVIAFVTSFILQKEEATKLRGDSTISFSLFHLVSIDIESFPTGIVIFQIWQISSDKDLTELNKSLLDSFLFGLAIQFAEIFTSDNLLTPLDKIFKIDSDKAILTEASAFFTAIGDFSPIAIASPPKPSKEESVTALSATGI